MVGINLTRKIDINICNFFYPDNLEVVASSSVYTTSYVSFMVNSETLRC